MTVRELIDHLLEVPLDSEIIVNYETHAYRDIKKVRINNVKLQTYVVIEAENP